MVVVVIFESDFQAVEIAFHLCVDGFVAIARETDNRGHHEDRQDGDDDENFDEGKSTSHTAILDQWDE